MKNILLFSVFAILISCTDDPTATNFIRSSKEETQGFDYEADYDHDGIKNFDEIKNNQDPYIANIPQIELNPKSVLEDATGDELSELLQQDSIRPN